MHHPQPKLERETPLRHPGLTDCQQVVEKTRKQIEEEIIEVGKRTIIDLGIHGLHPELVKIVGRMKFRSSYGQNLLQHSREDIKGKSNYCKHFVGSFGLL